MFFRRFLCLKSLNALRAVCGMKRAGYYFLKRSEKYFRNERTSPCASRKAGGSLTVEAALVFPLFVFGITALLYLFMLLQLQTELGRALTDVGKELSRDAYMTEGEDGLASSLLSGLYGTGYVQDYLEGRAAAQILEEKVSLLGSKWDPENSMLTLRASCRVALPPGFSRFHPITVVEERTVRGFTGFEGRSSGLAEGEEVVYITDYGTVYHRSLECRHLKLSISSAGMDEIEELRNADGGKYYPCERCRKSATDRVYITESGNRYHEALNCPGLIRGIRTVLLSQTGGMPPCSVCGS